MSRLPYTLVIATYERPEDLGRLLASVGQQTRPPERVIIVDSSRDARTEQLVGQLGASLPLLYQRAEEPSAARQRNQGACGETAPLLGFFDDDMVLAPDVCEKICAAFEADSAGRIGGIAARIAGESHPVPRGLLRLYYRWQAGFAHPDYGGKLFGPVINCYPAYTGQENGLVPSDWLNAGCVFYRTPLFQRELFPHFHGYSFMEDVHLSVRIGKTHQLFFHAGAVCEHHCGTNTLKRDTAALARMRLQNQRLVAREVLGLGGPSFEAKLLLHRLFVTVAILRRRAPGWAREVMGTWIPWSA
jgi:GT2 family glycosyltransferase